MTNCLPFSMISTRFFRCGRMAQPMRIAICCIILMPVCRACHDFLLRQTALRKGSSEGMPRAEATTANALYIATHSNAVILDIAKINLFTQYITKCTIDKRPYKTCQISIPTVSQQNLYRIYYA